MKSSHKNEIALGLFILAAAAVLGYLSLQIGGISVKEGIEVYVTLDDASGLVKDADAMVAGVKVGSVKNLEVEHSKALLTLMLNRDAGLRVDVKATVRARSLLGEKYLSLLPESTDALLLKNGDAITQATVPVEIDQLVTIMGPILKEIDPKDVGAIFRSISSLLGDEPDTIKNIITNMESVTEEFKTILTDNRSRIDHIIGDMESFIKDTSKTFSSSRPALERTIANMEKVSSMINLKAPQLTDDITVIAANLRDVSMNLKDDYPKYSDRLDHLSENLINITDAFSPQSAQMAEDTAAAISNISATFKKMPQAVDQFNKMAPVLKRVLKRTDSLLDKLEDITYDDILQLWKEEGIKVKIF